MDSVDDDMHHASDYSGGDTRGMTSGDDGDGDNESFIDNDDTDDDDTDGEEDNESFIDNDDTYVDTDDDFDEYGTSHRQQNYTILNEKDICQRQEEDITKVSMVLTISRVSASILLRHYNWNVSEVHDAWFADEERVRKKVGLLEGPVFQISNTVKELDCGICFDSFTIDKMNAAACGHPFCSTCWTDYISTSITDGPGCLTLRCPEPSCRAAVGQDMINLLAYDDYDRDKYSHYLLRSYIEDNRKRKWCPAPGCNCAVDFIVGSSYDVSCNCTYRFCWNCTEDAHRPVDCSTVAKWMRKNSSETENMNWILANSKPCPECQRPIEKNHGCMHMICTPPCGYQFCWLCLGRWSDHGQRTGGYTACNRYEEAKQKGAYTETEKRREMAKQSLKRYTHYYERWTANQSSRLKAVADLKKMQSVHVGKLIDKQCQLKSQLKFITDAWVQIIECRRVLKWTYAYGYYIPEQDYPKRRLFEYLQGDAESGLERLHQCAEKELQGYLNSNGPSKDFNEFRKKLTGLTSVTRNYFENLVRALENGLSDVDSQGACSKSESSKKLGGTKGKGRKGKVTMSTSGGPSIVVKNSHWCCGSCTYANVNMTATTCQMCELPRFY